MLARIWALVIKEFLAILRDKKSRLVLIGPPLIQLLVFGYAATFDLNHIPYAVYNQDTGSASRELLGDFQGSHAFRQVAVLHSTGQIAPLIEQGKALLVLQIGPNFTADLLRHQQAPLQVIIDGRNSNTATLALNYVNSVLLSFDNRWAAAQQWGRPPAQLVVRAWFNPNLLSRWFIVPGIVALLTLVVTLLVTGLSVAREREQGTFDQLLVTPLTPGEILLGKALPGIIIGALEAAFISLVAVFWFQVPLLGSIPALALGLLLFLLAAVGIGLMISSLSLTQQQGLLGVFLFLVPAIILSGFATPIANMPPLVQDLTYLNPMRYFLVIVRGVFLEGDNISLLWNQYWPLALIALASMAAASWLFRHRMH
ncbi:ABC-2 transporter permease [Acidithiobacillus sp. CV18-2]|uniref:ABC-2 transporter permease n=1 Tax=Igneacidithiobacillus copahuensis TaxID=2724909 RepID=A0AAE2YRP5_9PROT|nr:ABC transporter permease [Igneacidithiobacillus copahuensis]MBU2753892.1 ABC-2 transporter permease [Acidithiobacillus sp. CV18-3]MBU2757410.1 ABC-2 transporter permease [Acidithiobacillus sp. BN09-2]MBU2777318.1 ABC-2 transporter permease [Acidithiobacillus sp. CV18-2]MBU2796199.1 ABC-2 transporter permease [Acidithiobacillus sp. VAN18-2]MBU2798400.1 ABC-2 transporter permease [Acidithiobacillus sp. VAN18-4]UTV82173.1 ABC transporter permease [Acidithiobacillus sp. YTS05]